MTGSTASWTVVLKTGNNNARCTNAAGMVSACTDMWLHAIMLTLCAFCDLLKCIPEHVYSGMQTRCILNN